VMLKRGYDRRLSVSAILGGASLAPIIPPSLLVVMIGSMVDTSIAKLLIAGILPGLLLAAMMIGYTYYRIYKDPKLEPECSEAAQTRATGKEFWMALVQTLPFMIVIFSVMGLILLGVATPNESAATGVIGSLIAAAIFRKLNVKMLYESLLGTCSVSTMIMIIIASSMLFGQLLSFTGATSGLVTWLLK